MPFVDGGRSVLTGTIDPSKRNKKRRVHPISKHYKKASCPRGKKKRASKPRTSLSDINFETPSFDDLENGTSMEERKVSIQQKLQQQQDGDLLFTEMEENDIHDRAERYAINCQPVKDSFIPPATACPSSEPQTPSQEDGKPLLNMAVSKSRRKRSFLMDSCFLTSHYPRNKFDNTLKIPIGSKLLRPQEKLVELVFRTIEMSPDGLLQVPQIYVALQNTYPFFRYMEPSSHTSWRSSVRHALYQKWFRKIRFRSPWISTKGCFWCINPQATKVPEEQKSALRDVPRLRNLNMDHHGKPKSERPRKGSSQPKQVKKGSGGSNTALTIMNDTFPQPDQIHFTPLTYDPDPFLGTYSAPANTGQKIGRPDSDLITGPGFGEDKSHDTSLLTPCDLIWIPGDTSQQQLDRSTPPMFGSALELFGEPITAQKMGVVQEREETQDYIGPDHQVPCLLSESEGLKDSPTGSGVDNTCPNTTAPGLTSSKINLPLSLGCGAEDKPSPDPTSFEAKFLHAKVEIIPRQFRPTSAMPNTKQAGMSHSINAMPNTKQAGMSHSINTMPNTKQAGMSHSTNAMPNTKVSQAGTPCNPLNHSTFHANDDEVPVISLAHFLSQSRCQPQIVDIEHLPVAFGTF